MKAIFSDAHANLEALQAVLADAHRQGVSAVYNLGDTTGYGPNPVECLDLAMGMQVVLLGNHDQAIFSDPVGFSPHAERSISWTRKLLESSVEEPALRERRIQFLAGLSPGHHEEGVLYVHGSPRNHLHEYVFPEDVGNERKMGKLGEQFGRLCFNGHTHLPGVFVEHGPGRWVFLGPEECADGFRVAGQRVICNVGAVGQPRDGDWRACYVLFDGDAVWFRRVEYDVETTIRKIYAIPELGNFLGERLREGR